MHEFDDCFDTNFLCVLASVVGEDGVLWCATEKVSKEQLDKAVSIVKEVLK